MRRIYQSEWQGISFETFAKPDPRRVADRQFYVDFYEAFFRKYKSWEELDHKWMVHKESVAEHILARTQGADSILSIGCGLGVIERQLLTEGRGSLEVTEVSEAPLRWLEPLLVNGAAHIGLFPGCVPSDRKYAYVFASTVDYCLDDRHWLEFLKMIPTRLSRDGRVMILSSEWVKLSRAACTIRGGKDLIKEILRAAKIWRPEQFWGWARSPQEYRESFAKAGLTILDDGILDENDVYWIEGRA
jgi:hypothetical protein